MLMGAGSEMINKMKQNRAMRLKPKNNIFISGEMNGLKHINFKASQLNKLTEKEFKSFKKELNRKRMYRSIKLFLLFLIILSAVILTIYYFLINLV